MGEQRRRGRSPRPTASRRPEVAVAGQHSPRSQNLALVLREVVAAPTPPSRAQLAQATGLTRATVSSLVEWLRDAGLVSEQEPVLPVRAGRPAVPLLPAAGTVAGIGLEIGLDYLGVRAVDLGGALLSETVEPGDFRGSEPAPVLARARDLLRATLRRVRQRGTRVSGIGMALPGLIDADTGLLRIAPNLGWRDVDVVAGLVTGAVTAPVQVGNEADFAARAEARARRSTGPTSFVYVSGEVGVGSAIVLDGHLLRGRHGWSGEIGHTALGTTGSLRDGGTLEEYAGKDAILRSAGLPLDTSTAILADSAGSGRPRTVDALTRAGDALGVAVANVANLVDVQDVVLGGMYAELGTHLADRVAAQLQHRLLSAPWAPPQVHLATAGPYPAMTGAGLAALDAVLMDPLGWSERQRPEGDGRPTEPDQDTRSA